MIVGKLLMIIPSLNRVNCVRILLRGFLGIGVFWFMGTVSLSFAQSTTPIFGVYPVVDGEVVESGSIEVQPGEVFEVRVRTTTETPDLTANITLNGEEYLADDGSAACRSDGEQFIGWTSGDNNGIDARIACTIPRDIDLDDEIGLVGYQFRNCPDADESCSRTESPVSFLLSDDAEEAIGDDDGEQILSRLFEALFSTIDDGGTGGRSRDDGRPLQPGTGFTIDDNTSPFVGEDSQATGLAALSDTFVRDILAVCPGGTVNTSTAQTCLQPTMLTNSRAELGESVGSSIAQGAISFARQTVPVRGGVYQCVAFIQTVLHAYHEDPQYNTPRGIYAKMWFNPGNQPPGYVRVSKGSGEPIQPGDIPIWNYDLAGHIAVATEVNMNTDGSVHSFVIAEGNVDGAGTVSNDRIISIDDPGLLGWIRYVGA